MVYTIDMSMARKSSIKSDASAVLLIVYHVNEEEETSLLFNKNITN